MCPVLYMGGLLLESQDFTRLVPLLGQEVLVHPTPCLTHLGVHLHLQGEDVHLL